MTAFKTDMEAADEIPRQLQLRDLGGVIICDFIDLRYERHRRELEERLHDNFKNDRAKTKVLRMSQFGIIEMTRQRMRPSLKRSIYFDCPHCKGAGLVKTPESMSLDVMRRLAIAINDLEWSAIELSVCPDVAFYLQNKKRQQLADLEARLRQAGGHPRRPDTGPRRNAARSVRHPRRPGGDRGTRDQHQHPAYNSASPNFGCPRLPRAAAEGVRMGGALRLLPGGPHCPSRASWTRLMIAMTWTVPRRTWKNANFRWKTTPIWPTSVRWPRISHPVTRIDPAKWTSGLTMARRMS